MTGDDATQTAENDRVEASDDVADADVDDSVSGDVDDEDEAEQALMDWMTSRNLAQMDMSDTTIRFGLLLIAAAVVMP